MDFLAQSYFINYQVLIGDINYGNHVGGDALVSIMHEARIKYLHSLGNFSEVSVYQNIGLIMTNLNIQFKQQLVYGDKIQVYVNLSELKRSRFTLRYDIVKNQSIHSHTCFTSMAFFDYHAQKISMAPELFLEALKKEKTLASSSINH